MRFDYLDIDSATGNVPTRRVGDLVAYPDSAIAYPGQGRLDFTPAASELAHAIRGRETRAARMLARLRQGPATTFDLMMLGGAGFSSRLKELRRAGHVIKAYGGPERYIYELEGE
jgi:hypothetical protein